MKKKTQHPRKELAVPELTKEELEALASADAEIRASGLVNVLEKTLPAIPPSYQYRPKSKEFIANAFHASFDLIGGVPALLLWANQNPGDFYKLYAKMLPEVEKGNVQGTQVVVHTHIGKSALDEATFTEAHIVDADFSEKGGEDLDE